MAEGELKTGNGYDIAVRETEVKDLDSAFGVGRRTIELSRIAAGKWMIARVSVEAYPGMTDREIRQVLRVVRDALRESTSPVGK